jgi:hypothetical protein
MKLPQREPIFATADALLAESDQYRFMRLVELLALVPEHVYYEGREMVKELVDHNPESIEECTTDLDAAIQYLESCLDSRPN